LERTVSERALPPKFVHASFLSATAEGTTDSPYGQRLRLPIASGGLAGDQTRKHPSCWHSTGFGMKNLGPHSSIIQKVTGRFLLVTLRGSGSTRQPQFRSIVFTPDNSDSFTDTCPLRTPACIRYNP